MRNENISYGISPSSFRFPPSSRLSGDRRQLVIMTAFADRTFKEDEEQTMELWEKIFNTENYNETPFYGSVHDYFHDQSYGLLNLSFDLHYVTLADNCSKYRSTSSDDENSKYLVADIVEVLQQRGINWSLYDWDEDGYIDQLLIIYAGKGQNAGGGSNSIWPHQWWLSEHDNCQPISVNSEGHDYLVDCYCCVQELDQHDAYGTFGTICHEYSHCFGLPDFYNGSRKYVDRWDLMDYGNYNGDGFLPCGYSAFERYFMGWLTPTELTNATTITSLPALSDEPQAYLIRNDGHFNEYYLVENRQLTGWDAELPGNGIIIAHVDYDEEVFRIGMPNGSGRNRYTIFAANNHAGPTSFSYVSGWAYPTENNDELTNISTPAAILNNANDDGTLFMSKPITAMTVTDGLASFDFMGGTTGINTSFTFTNTPNLSSSIYSLDGRYLGIDPANLSHGIYIIRNAYEVHKVIIK